MASEHIPATAPMRDWRWSQAEKIVACRAFEVALNREQEIVIREAKERAGAGQGCFGPVEDGRLASCAPPTHQSYL